MWTNEVASTGMGQVYQATDTQLGRLNLTTPAEAMPAGPDSIVKFC